MHEADDAYSIRSTWSCYWLDQFLTLALNTLILSIFYISLDLSTISILLILVGVELPLCVVVTLSQNVVLCFLESNWVWDRLFYYYSFDSQSSSEFLFTLLPDSVFPRNFEAFARTIGSHALKFLGRVNIFCSWLLCVQFCLSVRRQILIRMIREDGGCISATSTFAVKQTRS